jgi:hypothetical protein
VPKLARFGLPAGLPDQHPDVWNARVKRILVKAGEPELPQFYDPTTASTPATAARPMVMWTAFPATLRATVPSPRARWKRADKRAVQDEYCEWAVTRDAAGKITRVTFTSEVPEYFDHLNRRDPAKLRRLYRRLVSPEVQLADLRVRGTRRYNPRNKWNRGARLAHLTHPSNNLFAAAALVAQATVPRIDADGRIIISQQELTGCAGLGEPLRSSDPQIANAVNVAARQGDEIALADPPGLYLGKPVTAGMVTPDGADAARFWKIERGDAEHTLRARFEVPKARGYAVGDIKIRDRPIEFGAQVAERVPVWVEVIVKAADHTPTPVPCVS